MIANIVIRRRIRGNNPPKPRSLVVMAILNCCSFLCGGLIVWPFGITLGVYQIWFATSDQGKAFLAAPDMSPLLNPAQYHEPEAHRWR